MTDHTQDIPHPESLAALASLLDQYATGSGRITPRPRGARLSEDVRTMLADAIAAVESAASSAGPAADLLVYGNGCYAVGRHADASGVYLSILEDEPSNAEARFNLGLAYLRLRSPEDAVREFTGLLVQEPLLAEAFYQRGNGNDDLGQTERALADYERAIELDPEYNRGILLAKAGRHEEAVAQFDKVNDMRPDISNSYLNRGASLDELGLHEEAITAFTRAAELDPDNAMALFNRARTNYYLGNLHDALADYSEVIQLTPDDAEAFNNRGLTFDALGDYDNAIEDFDSAIELRPIFAEAHSNRGAVLEITGDLDAALEEYRHSLEDDPELASAHYNAARLYSRTGDVAACLTHLDRVLEIAPQLAQDAAHDEHLGWALEIRNLRREQGPEGAEEDRG